MEIALTESGPSPVEVMARRGEHLRLAITRKTDSTCAKQLVVDGIQRPLPLDETVLVDITATTSGTVRIMCRTGTGAATLMVK